MITEKQIEKAIRDVSAKRNRS
ncbi:MAG: hypothetical protein QOK29_4319, partial [Rhodospirillaceae bacterium]|nr:hypothetical protein [Rhodospirillaceae bacterium]